VREESDEDKFEGLTGDQKLALLRCFLASKFESQFGKVGVKIERQRRSKRAAVGRASSLLPALSSSEANGKRGVHNCRSMRHVAIEETRESSEKWN
jgi:hypothetical protein